VIKLLGERALCQRLLENAAANSRFQLVEQCENGAAIEELAAQLNGKTLDGN
jgi:hypothetical protein